MRFLPVFLFVLIFGCSNDADSPTTTTAPTATAEAPPVVPFDRKLTGDTDLDPIRSTYAQIEDQYLGGMLQQNNVSYVCGENIRGVVELYSEKDQVVLAINKYRDGDQLTMLDRWYFKDGQLIFQYTESNSWQFDGPMIKDNNGNEIPGVRSAISEYRYYVKDGATFKFLKKNYEVFTHRTDNVDPLTLPFEEVAVPDGLPYKYKLLKNVLENNEVDCSFFTTVE